MNNGEASAPGVQVDRFLLDSAKERGVYLYVGKDGGIDKVYFPAITSPIPDASDACRVALNRIRAEHYDRVNLRYPSSYDELLDFHTKVLEILRATPGDWRIEDAEDRAFEVRAADLKQRLEARKAGATK